MTKVNLAFFVGLLTMCTLAFNKPNSTMVASSTRRIYTIVNKSATAKTIGSYNNLSGATVTTMAANTSIELQSDGTTWHQIR